MEFDLEKISKVNQDYSLFHPSIKQLEAMYDMASFVAENLGLEDKTVRNITIKCTVQYQKELSKFHYEHREALPQARIVVTSDIGKILSDELKSLLKYQDEASLKMIDEILDNSFNAYMKRHANQ